MEKKIYDQRIMGGTKMNFLNDLLKDKNEVDAITDSISLSNSVLELTDTIVQLKNIESVSLVKANNQPYPVAAVIGAIIGLLLLSNNRTMFIGLIVTAICIFVLYNTYVFNKKIEKNVYIYLSSGRFIVLAVNENRFAKEILSTFHKHFDGSDKRPVIINIKDSNVTYGDNSGIHV